MSNIKLFLQMLPMSFVNSTKMSVDLNGKDILVLLPLL